MSSSDKKPASKSGRGRAGGNPNLNNERIAYQERVKAMTPEEYRAHRHQMAVKKELTAIRTLGRLHKVQLQEAFEYIIQAQLPQWAAETNNMMVAQVAKAREGDTQAFNAVMPYLVSKKAERSEVKNTITIDNLKDVSDEDITFLLEENLSDDEDTDD